MLLLLLRQRYSISLLIISLYTISLTLSTLLQSSPTTTCSISSQQYNALYALYVSTNGTGWLNRCNKSWLFPLIPDYNAPCNGWNGVKCNTQCQVIELNVQACQLDGTIPSQLGYLTSIQQLNLNDNSLSGTIPTEIGYMNKIQKLYLNINSLSGTIPSQLGNMTKLTIFWIYSNSLTGTIPTQMESMTNMLYLWLNNNFLTGTIPTQMGSMTYMEQFYLYSNSLTGTIPSQLGSMTNMQYLDLSSNSLTGTIPSQLGSMTSMQYLILYSNSLTGTILSQLGSMANMTNLWLYSNSLTGTIPSQLGSMASLQYLSLYSNSLTGTIPSQLGSLTSITNLFLYSNSLTGTIPSQLGSIPSMLTLYLNSNSLTGTIPSQLGKSQLEFLYLQDNSLTGLIPSTILRLQRLTSIDLSDNRHLGGNITSLLSSNTSTSLQYIILSSMSLTGSLPTSLFSLPHLDTLILSSNCITGTLSSTVCLTNLSSLILDGIGAGSSCRNNRHSSFHGMIPSCLFSMLSLRTLHLAGNGLTGTLPELSLSSNLSTLSLTSNRLTGDILQSVQLHMFTSVDLSSNKLSGTLIDTYQPPNSSLILTVNHLSGKIPSSLRATNSTISVLEGNLFGCPLLRNDESSRKTSCGSSNLDYPIIAWLVVSVVTLITAVYYLFYSKLRIVQSISRWWCVIFECSSSELYHTRSTIRYLECGCSMIMILVALYVSIAMTSFIAMKLQGSHFNSLYQEQYLYITTSAYLVGLLPTLLIWMYVLLSGNVVVLFSGTTRPGRYTANDIESNESVNYQEYIKSLAIRLAVTVAVSSLAIAINYGFVQTVYFGKPSNLTAVNLAFAIIKSMVSGTVVPLSTRLVPKASKQSHTILMMIIVNVISPGLAVVVSSPLCLYDYFQKKSISANYQYPVQSCAPFIPCILHLVPGSSVIMPRWFYSYQCSSSYLTSYLPNFIYLYIIKGIISPILNLLAMILSSHCTDYQQESTLIKAFNFISDNFMAGRIFYVRDIGAENSVISIEMPELDQSSNRRSSRINRITTVSKEHSSHKDYDIEVADLMPSLCVDVTILLTFGLASPLFAVIVACSVIVNTLLWRLALGRYISIVSKAMSTHACYEKLERAFEDESRCLSRSWWMMSVFVGLFWSIFVSDMVGDKYPRIGIVAAVVMALWCPCVFISLQWLLSVNPDNDTDTSNIDSSCSGSRLRSIRYRVHGITSRIHEIIWTNILRIDSTGNGEASNDKMREEPKKGDRGSIINETISPMGHLKG